MFGIGFQKIWNQKWLFFCMLLGSILLVATACSFPMYRNAVFNRMLQDEMEAAWEESGKWPMILEYTISVGDKEGVGAVASGEKLAKNAYTELGLTESETLYYYAISSSDAVPELERKRIDDISLRVSFIGSLEDHVELIDGEMYSEAGVDADGYLEAIIDEQCMLTNNIIIGDTFIFGDLHDENGETVRVKIVGVYKKTDITETFWQRGMSMYTNNLMIRESTFRQKFATTSLPGFTMVCRIYDLVDFSALDAGYAKDLLSRTEEYQKRSSIRALMKEPEYTATLQSYLSRESRINTTLFILQVPILLLLCAFLLMISNQVYELEKNDISVLKSRGASRTQIFLLYLLQSSVMSLGGFVLGIPLGNVFCRILGSASNFLEFKVRRSLKVEMTGEVLGFALGAAIIAIAIMSIPALKHSKVTIVNLKSQKVQKRHSWWEICFLDLIFLGISIYGYYNYSHNTDALIESALKNEALDPLLYISSTLFILGAGMLLLRLQPLMVRIIYLVRKGWCGPASYASFLEAMRNGRKQQYIMLFMILTVSLGMFDAVSARTILQNTRANTAYLDATDLRVAELWENNSNAVAIDPSVEFTYYEPDYSRYADFDEVETFTKVYYDDTGYIQVDRRERIYVTIMGIHTREFGQITELDDDLLEEPYYQLLNELAATPNGVLMSSAFKDRFGYKVGDTVNYGPKPSVIIGFFDYWPTYVPEGRAVDENNETYTYQNYMVVMNYAYCYEMFGLKPYQVWMKLKDGADTGFFYRWVASEGIRLNSYVDRTEDLEDVTEDPLLQGMNGVLTMSFIVMLILCAVGYLIYWILSIRSREMMLGVLRAFGMHKGELLHMLVNEQLFSGLYSILAGVIVGNLAYRLYVPMLQMAYSTTSQVLPMELITSTGDMVRLYSVVTLTMVVCLGVLAMLIFRLNITKALKLGEE
ncbi:MAG: ABC transporter permease [Lachnospiraceae bacterium]|nr:ABC transporter permease [Lachnospiraceae bacterium]